MWNRARLRGPNHSTMMRHQHISPLMSIWRQERVVDANNPSSRYLLETWGNTSRPKQTVRQCAIHTANNLLGTETQLYTLEIMTPESNPETNASHDQQTNHEPRLFYTRDKNLPFKRRSVHPEIIKSMRIYQISHCLLSALVCATVSFRDSLHAAYTWIEQVR